MDAVLAASPGLVAFLTGHVVESHLALPSRDSRLEKPALALVTAEGAITIASDPRPAVGDSVAYGLGAVGLADDATAFDAVQAAAQELDLSGRVAVEGAYVPSGAIDALRRGQSRVQLEPLGAMLREAKQVKDGEELAGLREALALCDAAQDAVRTALREGATEVELYAAAVAGACRRAGRHVLVGCELLIGRRSHLGMGPPTDLAIAEGELVMSDIFPRHSNGWWGDSCLTLACGDPSPQAQADWRALRDALEAGRERLRPGVRCREVYEAVVAHSGPLPVHAGHGIGRDHYEDPHLIPGNDTPLLDGTVVVLEPGRYRTGEGIRLEWAFLVSDEGGIPLTSFSLDL